MKSPIGYLKEQRNYLSGNPNRLWFKRKLYGWGWTPATAQGWFVIFAFIVLLSVFILDVREYYGAVDFIINFALPVLTLVIVLIAICYKKGESPKWQWGREEEGSN